MSKKIVGIGKAEFSFHGEDGQFVKVSGSMFYTEEDGSSRKNSVLGVCTDSFFFSDSKLEKLTFIPQVNDIIEVSESRYNGKRRVTGMIKVG